MIILQWIKNEKTVKVFNRGLDFVDRYKRSIPTLKRHRDTWQAWDTTRERPLSIIDRVPPSSNLKSSAQDLAFNPDSSGPTSPQVKRPRARVHSGPTLPQVKRPRARVQPRLVGPNIITTDEPDSLSTLEASERLLQYSLATGFSELSDQISTI